MMTDVSLCFPARLSILPSAIPPTTIFLGRDFLAQFIVPSLQNSRQTRRYARRTGGWTDGPTDGRTGRMDFVILGPQADMPAAVAAAAAVVVATWPFHDDL